jgi:hypothetical protein
VATVEGPGLESEDTAVPFRSINPAFDPAFDEISSMPYLL